MPDIDRQPPRRLTSLPLALSEAGYTPETTPSYRMLHQRAIDRRIPAHQVRGIWHWYPRDLPVIAEALGLGRDDRADPAPVRLHLRLTNSHSVR